MFLESTKNTFNHGPELPLLWWQFATFRLCQRITSAKQKLIKKLNCKLKYLLLQLYSLKENAIKRDLVKHEMKETFQLNPTKGYILIYSRCGRVSKDHIDIDLMEIRTRRRMEITDSSIPRLLKRHAIIVSLQSFWQNLSITNAKFPVNLNRNLRQRIQVLWSFWF